MGLKWASYLRSAASAVFRADFSGLTGFSPQVKQATIIHAAITGLPPLDSRASRSDTAIRYWTAAVRLQLDGSGVPSVQWAGSRGRGVLVAVTDQRPSPAVLRR